jgi:hypothetical protein
MWAEGYASNRERGRSGGDKESDDTMIDTVLHDAPSLITRIAADTRRVWADTPGLTAPATLGLAMPSASGVRQAIRLTAFFFVLPLWLVACLLFGTPDSHAASPSPSRPTEVWPVEAAFRGAVQLWANEQFEALWEHGLRASRYRISREVFVRGMRHRVLKPTCCWDQIHAVQVHLQATDEALVEAQVGVDVKTLGTTVRRRMIVYLRQEEGIWRVTLEDFLTKPEDAQSGLRMPW